MKSRNRMMLEKSISAMLAAMEIYNKPDFKYREEAFSVLCVNSWELLLKAKVLLLSANNISSLYIWEKKVRKNKEKTKRSFKKLNRSGNPMSVSIHETYRIIVEEYGVKIDKAVKDNLEMLIEIRDNSVHFINNDLSLALKVQEIGTAALQNYLHLVKEWFGDVLSKYNFYLMLLSFFRDFDSISGETLNSSEKKLLNYIKAAEKVYEKDSESLGEYNLAIKVDVKFFKAKSSSGLPVLVTNDPSAPTIRLSEEHIFEKYPWDFRVLTTRLKKRYSNFKCNKSYHDLRKSMEGDESLCHQRYYNPSKSDSGKKVLYSPNILKEFDKHYEKSGR
ncbi:DUF3644 domain-containing protein [Kushneria indalinina]|uniref:Uncharacterized protein DUF3644 n=1 Tax=Kushneria indalinina DSM 14324 TaxID=1122140 RepID=A0A3D9DW98_9GAMM|nr:DUF3644 domain-containing protein [Kushneria indalinina]REC95037.1 uncharacterized protein DUF3644 [Kushneria indalinina DSM 14324]